MSPLVATLVLIAGGFLVSWARRVEADMPQCDECGPMYFQRHHPDCPYQGRAPDANYDDGSVGGSA